MRTGLLGLVGVGVAVWAVSSVLSPPSDPQVSAPATVDADAVEVDVTEVVLGDAATFHVTTGTVVAAEAMPVPSPQGGAIDTFEVADGDRVDAGDVIVRLQQVAETASLMSAEARFEQAEAVLDRARDVAGTDLDVGVDKAALEAEIEQAKRVLEAAQSSVEAHNIRAPFAGTVQLVEGLTMGSVLMSGNPVAFISTEDRLLMRFQVPRDLAPMVSQGAAVEVVDADGTVRTALVEAEVGGEGAVGETLTLEAVFDGESDGLDAGDEFEVRVPVERVEPRPLVPQAALAQGPTGAVVFRVAEGVARSVPVQTGAATEAGVEVSGALQPGDRVAVSSLEALADGMPVRER